MSSFNNNILLVIIAVIVLIIVIYYLNKNNDQPVPNQGQLVDNIYEKYTNNFAIKNNNCGNIIDDDATDCNDNEENFVPKPRNYNNDNYGYFKKTYSDEEPCDEKDNRDFVFKKKDYTLRTHEDLKDLYDVDKLLPNEEQPEWFDQPLQNTKKLKGTSFMHPKIHMGANTKGSSLKNGTRDFRGDIITPKIDTLWMCSTIDPDTNLRGIWNQC